MAICHREVAICCPTVELSSDNGFGWHDDSCLDECRAAMLDCDPINQQVLRCWSACKSSVSTLKCYFASLFSQSNGESSYMNLYVLLQTINSLIYHFACTCWCLHFLNIFFKVHFLSQQIFASMLSFNYTHLYENLRRLTLRKYIRTEKSNFVCEIRRLYIVRLLSLENHK